MAERIQTSPNTFEHSKRVCLDIKFDDETQGMVKWDFG